MKTSTDKEIKTKKQKNKKKMKWNKIWDKRIEANFTEIERLDSFKLWKK